MGLRSLVVVGGGTGGHVFPAVSLARVLRERGHDVVVVSDQRGENFASVQQDPHKKILSFKRTPALLFACTQVIAVVKCVVWFLRHRPALVISFGGYVSLPVMLAARSLRIPLVIHEQNAVLGRAHRVGIRWAKRVATCFPSVMFVPAHLPVIKVGNPVRSEVAALSGRTYEPSVGADPFTLLVLGGSQGAKVFSEVIPAALEKLDPHLLSRLRIIQQCRSEFLEETRAAYAALGVEAELSPFFEAVEHVYAQAHLVIARAGASTCAELMVAGCPALLVPYPYAADDHQRVNAEQLEKNGGPWMMLEKEFTPDKLRFFLATALKSHHLLSERAARMAALGQPTANQDLANVIEVILGSSNIPSQTPEKVRA